MTAFPEESQEAGKNGKDIGEIPLNLLAFPCKSGGFTRTEG
jgi:hypothetical protein